MRGGTIIGLPLTLLQWGVHQHTGAQVDVGTIANNFLVANAVYDADRINAPLLSSERFGTRASLLLSSMYYASDVHTAWLPGVVTALHFGYSAIKPYVAPVKPFFVAFFWTVAIYYVPAWRSSSLDVHVDLLTPASLFLSIASLSHAADVVDADDDLADGVLTPAVRMRGDEAVGYAMALGFASAFLHSQSPSDFLPYDALALASILGIVNRRADVAVLLGCAFVLAFVHENGALLVETLLTSSEVTHKIAIDNTIRAVGFAQELQEPWRSRFLDVVFGLANGGDAFGHHVFRFYEDIVR